MCSDKPIIQAYVVPFLDFFSIHSAFWTAVMVSVVFLKNYFSQRVFPKVVISYATHTAQFVYIHFFVVDIFETEKHERARRHFKIERTI